MSPALKPEDPDWDELIRLFPRGFDWTDRAEEDRRLRLNIWKRYPTEDFVRGYILSRGEAGKLSWTKWGPKDDYPDQKNYEIRGRIEDQDVYVKLCIAERSRERVIRITSFKPL